MSSQQRHLEHTEDSGSKISIAIQTAFSLMHQTQPKILKKTWKISYRGQMSSLLIILYFFSRLITLKPSNTLQLKIKTY